MKKNVTLYNALFPLWMILIFPQSWLIVIPGNFIIDSLVLLIAIKVLKIENIWKFYRSSILKVFSLGLVADFIGSIYILIFMIGFKIGHMGDELYLTIPALLISAICIFVFNYYISFRKCEKKIRFKLALTFAIATAPYTFLFQSSWLYG